MGKCQAGPRPVAGPGAGAGATLGTPGRNALHPGSNRFIQFRSRSAGCVRSGEAAAASFPRFKPLVFSSWKTREPQRVGQGFQVGLGHTGHALSKGNISFPVPCTANPLGLKILELQESLMRFRRKHQDMHLDLDLHIFSENKSQG